MSTKLEEELKRNPPHKNRNRSKAVSRRQFVSRYQNRMHFTTKGMAAQANLLQLHFNAIHNDALSCAPAVFRKLDPVGLKIAELVTLVNEVAVEMATTFKDQQCAHLDSIVDSINYEINMSKVGYDVEPWDSTVPMQLKRPSPPGRRLEDKKTTDAE